MFVEFTMKIKSFATPSGPQDFTLGFNAKIHISKHRITKESFVILSGMCYDSFIVLICSVDQRFLYLTAMLALRKICCRFSDIHILEEYCICRHPHTNRTESFSS